MQINTLERKPYSPQLSYMGAVSIRRLAWYLHKPMTFTLDYIIKNLPYHIDSEKVCESCKDKKCYHCIFRPLPTEEKTEVSA